MQKITDHGFKMILQNQKDVCVCVCVYVFYGRGS